MKINPWYFDKRCQRIIIHRFKSGMLLFATEKTSGFIYIDVCLFVTIIPFCMVQNDNFITKIQLRSNGRKGVYALFLSAHDVIKWKHFPRYWPFVRGIHRSPVNSRHTGQWRWAWKFSLICAWINVWVNNRKAGDLIRHRANYDVTVMSLFSLTSKKDRSRVRITGPLMFLCHDIIMIWTVSSGPFY